MYINVVKRKTTVRRRRSSRDVMSSLLCPVPPTPVAVLVRVRVIITITVALAGSPTIFLPNANDIIIRCPRFFSLFVFFFYVSLAGDTRVCARGRNVRYGTE